MEGRLDAVAGKRVLVTGGCGFIGTNLVFELVRRGAEVSVLDLPSADWPRLPTEARVLKADICRRDRITGAAQGMDIVYHLAARSDLDGTALSDYRVNVVGTGNLVDEASRAGVGRFVFYSTQLVVGLFNETRFIDETEPYRTNTVYGESKISAEKIVKAACPAAGIEYTIIRPTSVYGPRGEEPYRDFFRLIKRRRYWHVGKATNLVSWIYVRNLVDLTILASLSPNAADETFFANDFHPYTMREIVNTVGDYYGLRIPTVPSALVTAAAYACVLPRAAGVKVPIYPFRLRNIKASYCYDIEKSVRMGYEPEYDLKRGVGETLDWYESKRLI
jgi:nucleoside-diphosphate-sugar epimerase